MQREGPASAEEAANAAAPSSPPAPPSRLTQARGVAGLLLQVSRRVQEKRAAGDLHAVQWSALRYLSRAGRRTATVAGLARYLDNTTGSASRTIKSLRDRGLIAPSRARHDARSVLFTLTPEGEETLADDPLNDVAASLAALDEADLARFASLLDHVEAALAKDRP